MFLIIFDTCFATQWLRITLLIFQKMLWNFILNVKGTKRNYLLYRIRNIAEPKLKAVLILLFVQLYRQMKNLMKLRRFIYPVWWKGNSFCFAIYLSIFNSILLSILVVKSIMMGLGIQFAWNAEHVVLSCRTVQQENRVWW